MIFERTWDKDTFKKLWGNLIYVGIPSLTSFLIHWLIYRNIWLLGFTFFWLVSAYYLLFYLLPKRSKFQIGVLS